jgi:hypothetical protein
MDAARGNDLHRLAGQGGLVTLAGLDDGGDEHRRGDIARVTATLTALTANDITAKVEALLDVLGVANHVHVDDAGLVEPLNDVLRGDADSGYEQLGTGLDYDIN